jgi:GxxExxY protein
MSERLPIPQETERLASIAVDSAFRVHSTLAPGLLESVYETCLAHELAKRGLRVQKQVILPITYDGVSLESGLRIDMIVGGTLIIEVKSVEKMISLFESQILTYLRLSGLRLGLLINFNVPLIRDGIRRFVM